jgi:hypothetical protein
MMGRHRYDAHDGVGLPLIRSWRFGSLIGLGREGSSAKGFPASGATLSLDRISRESF